MPRPVSLIVIHCAATPNGKRFRAEDILRWHTDPPPQGRGWSAAGYHYVVELDGAQAPLVPLNDDDFLEPWEIANGAAGYNGHSVHVCLIGTDRFTHAQWLSLTDLSYSLAEQFPRATLVGHRDLNPAKACPGFDVAAWLAQGRGPLEDHVL